MKWGHIVVEVLWLYFKVAFVCFAYFGAKIFIAQNRPSLNPPFSKQIGGYLRCIAAVAVIGLVASGTWEGDDDDAQLVSMDYNRGATVFITLLIPALIGAAVGYTTREEFPINSRSNYDDM